VRAHRTGRGNFLANVLARAHQLGMRVANIGGRKAASSECLERRASRQAVVDHRSRRRDGGPRWIEGPTRKGHGVMVSAPGVLWTGVCSGIPEHLGLAGLKPGTEKESRE
jgi:hypothetical protein